MAQSAGAPSAGAAVGAEDQLDPVVLKELEELGGPEDPQFVTGILTAFLAETPQQLKAIETTMAGGDPAAIGKAAHALKGSARGIGAKRLQEITFELEQRGRAGKVTARKLLLAQIKAALDAVSITVRSEILRRQSNGK
jgi:HPt (histidine-containing phosphotransfer) domain-containing protein